MPNPSQDSDIASLDRTSLDRAFDALYQDRDRDGADLRKAICAFVDVAKSTGWTIERIIIDVKKTAARSALAQRQATRTKVGNPEAVDGLVAESVRWCIQRYYEGLSKK